ncbi:MAG: hypothetical protein AB1716_05995 [Planctomycetota bacterium]
MRDVVVRSLPFSFLFFPGAVLMGCGPVPAPSDAPAGFTPISEPGFDAADNAVDRNDYPWEMTYFKPDDREVGRLYVGTGNAVRLEGYLRHLAGGSTDFWRPPEIRRYRPDQGPESWERVLDWRALENGPPWQTTGVRALLPYRVASTGETYLYAGTFGSRPTLWRSRTGDPGTWASVWSTPTEGSIRSLVVHSGILYVAVTHESLGQRVPGEIYATDGQSVWPVMTDGFGKLDNNGIYVLASFNNWLYAGTINLTQGFEVWKLAGPGGPVPPVRVIAGGGTSRAQHAVGDMRVFKGHLYVTGIILLNLNFEDFSPPYRAADMLRIDDQNRVEVVVGTNSVGGVPSGFGYLHNAYLWCLEEHGGKLYCGTWNSADFVPMVNRYLARFQEALSTGALFGASSGDFDPWTRKGARVYASEDGVSWYEVFKDGLGNYRNFAVRNMVSTGDALYLGLANIDEGLQIWSFVE